MSLPLRSMAHLQRAEDKHIGAAVSSSSSLESVNSADVEVSFMSTDSKSSSNTRTSLPNLASASQKLDEPIKEWQNIFQPLLTGEAEGSVPFQAYLDLFTSTQLLQQSRAATGSAPLIPQIPPAPPLPAAGISRKTKKSSSPTTASRPGILASRSLDFGAGVLASSPPPEAIHVPSTSPPTLFQSTERYRYYLEAATSMMTQHGEDTITYLNKGQFYGVVFECRPDPERRIGPRRKVRSIVSLVFREERDEHSELQLWEYWHLQQPNQLLRAFDVDRKSASNVESIEDISHNATAFIWDACKPARVCLRVNCLSTEFSPQKGIRGMPLFLQIDTFDDLASPEPETTHRCYCKIKTFRDKGAERKNKDESKSADRRMAKILKQQQQQSARRRVTGHNHRPAPFPSTGSTSLANSTVHEVESESGSASWLPQTAAAQATSAARPAPPQAALAAKTSQTSVTDPSGFFQAPSKVTIFTTTSTFGRKPVFFVPRDMATNGLAVAAAAAAAPTLFDTSAQSAQLCAMIQEAEQQRGLPGRVDSAKDELSNLDMGGPRSKNPRTERRLPAVTVYVRKEDEVVYNAIMLDQLSVQEFSIKVGDKYDIPAGVIKNVFKRTKRGILVNMDDRMVQQFANEDDFVVQMIFDNQLGHCDLYLHY